MREKEPEADNSGHRGDFDDREADLDLSTEPNAEIVYKCHQDECENGKRLCPRKRKLRMMPREKRQLYVERIDRRRDSRKQKANKPHQASRNRCGGRRTADD